jgi:hypothetical protein
MHAAKNGWNSSGLISNVMKPRGRAYEEYDVNAVKECSYGVDGFIEVLS